MAEAEPAAPLSALYHNTSLQLTAGLQNAPYTHAGMRVRERAKTPSPKKTVMWMGSIASTIKLIHITVFWMHTLRKSPHHNKVCPAVKIAQLLFGVFTNTAAFIVHAVFCYFFIFFLQNTQMGFIKQRYGGGGREGV